MKVVINKCFGGFSLSDKGLHRFAELKGLTLYSQDEGLFISYYTNPDYTQDSYFSCYDIKRDDPDLVKVVEELGNEANGAYAELKVVEIPDDVKWYIHEYDGIECINEVHRTWS